MTSLPVPVHDRLEDRSEWSHSDAGANEYRMLGSEYVTGRSSIGSIDVNLQGFAHGEVDSFIRAMEDSGILR